MVMDVAFEASVGNNNVSGCDCVTIVGSRTGILASSEPSSNGMSSLILLQRDENEAKKRKQSIAGLLSNLDDQRVADGNKSGLASYLRVWALKQVQNAHF